MNQYWFSTATISTFVEEVEASGGQAALVSTPSIYFSLSEAARKRSKVLDFDDQWSSDPGFLFYDFNAPEDIPSEFHHTFDFVLVDPPFITAEVWAQYAITTRLLLRPGGRILCTTIAENAEMMEALLGLHPNRYRPSIPNLVYQYSVYTNYDSEPLGRLNPEIDDEDWMVTVQQKQSKPADGVGDVLRPSCKPNVSPEGSDNGKVQGVAGYCDGSPPMAAEAVPLPPAAELLTELRSRLSAMKRCAEAINAPVQTAIRRRQAGGDAAAAASAKAATALDAADTAASDLAAWLSSHDAAAAAAMAETPEAFKRSLQQDLFRTNAVAAMVAKARGDGLKNMAEYDAFFLDQQAALCCSFPT